MPEFQVSCPVLHQLLDGGLILSEALGFAEVSCAADTVAAATKSVRANIAELLKETPSNSWSRRWLPESPQPLEVRLTLSPAVRTSAWHEPAELTFPAVRWRQADDAWIAFIPALGIEVLSPREDELPRRIDEQVRAALMRVEATKSLRTLGFTQRASELQIETIEVKHEIKTPKRAAQDDDAGREQRESVLEKIATNLAKANVSDLFERDAELQQLAELLGGRHPRSVLLVGASGVGKTAILRGLARRSMAAGVEVARTPTSERSDVGVRATGGQATISFWETGGSRIVAGMTGFGMWQEGCRHLLEEVAKRASSHETVVLHAGPLLELMEVGQYEGNSQGVANFLRPAISRGELLVVAECTPERLAVFERRDPHLLHAFAQLRIDEPTVEQNRPILEHVARQLWPVAHAARVRTDSVTANAREPRAPHPEVLDTLDRLHRRYATYSANPGRPLRFLHALRKDHSLTDGPLTSARVTAAFARETGLPLWLLDDVGWTPSSDRSAEGGQPTIFDWFAARVIGQPDAVTAVTDLLAVVKAGLHREHFVRAVREFVRPELFNRVDAVVPFGAIDNATAQRIVERQLQLLRQRDGWHSRRLTFDIAPSVVEHLLVTGFDRRYGARSLKRVLERELLAPLSEQLNGYTGDTVLRGEVGVMGEQLAVTVRAQVADSGRTVRSLADEWHEDASLPRIRDLRRRASRLMNSAVAVELRNQLFRLAKFEERHRQKPNLSPDALRRLSHRDALLNLTTRVTCFAESAIALEDSALLRLYSTDDSVAHAARVRPMNESGSNGNDATHASRVRHNLESLEVEFRELLFDVHEQSDDSPKQIRLGLYGDQRAWSRLLPAYLAAAVVLQAKVEIWRLALPNSPRETPPPEFWSTEFVKWQWIEATPVPFWRLVFQRPESSPAWLLEAHPVRSPQTWLSEPDQGSLGVVLNVTGPRVFARFVGESGAHQFVFPSERRQCVVATALPDWKTFLPPRGIDRRGGLDGEPTRREYDEVKSVIVDSDDPRPFGFGRTAFEAAVAALLEARHVRDAEGMLAN